jgi:thiamine biosynthesis lipoprotein
MTFRIERCVGVLVLLMAVLAGCANVEKRFEFTRLEMGVKAHVVTYAVSQEQAEAGATEAFARIAALDACMSDYRSESEVMRLCAHAPGESVPLSLELFQVLDAAQHAAEASNGAFDVTVGPVVAIWRVARKMHEMPSQEAIDAAMRSIGWRNLLLDPTGRTATLLKPGMKIDLGGIAKGYAAAEGVKALRANGLPRSLVGLAGDICAGDPPPREKGWKIQISTGHEMLLLANASVSTSGDTEQFVELDGKRYSHIVDPRTGMAMTTSVQDTVVSTRGEVADALSTAISVMGVQQGAAMARAEGISAVIREPGGAPVVIDEAHLLRWAQD